MKLCCNCLMEIRDTETICSKCKSYKLIDKDKLSKIQKEIDNIVSKIQTETDDTKKKEYAKILSSLLDDPEYYWTYYDYPLKKEYGGHYNYSRPKILDLSSRQNTNKTDEEYWERINTHTINKLEKTYPTITCPYCNSTNTKKISTTAKVVNTALFGIFGTKRYKQWHCNNCGSDF